MTEQIEASTRESFSSIEVVSVVAVTVILVMIAVPFPYANGNHALPGLHPASNGKSVGADTSSDAEVGNGSSLGYASQVSPYQAITVGKREFCADMPGVVRFRTEGPSCRNGTTITSAQRHRDLQEKR